MSEGQLQWFRILYRSLAVAVLLSLVGGLVNDVYGVRSQALAATTAAVSLFGSLAFLLVGWAGVRMSYVSATSMALYAMLFVAALIVIAGIGPALTH